VTSPFPKASLERRRETWLPPATGSDIHETPAPPQKAASTPRRVLIIDDEAVIRELIGLQLRLSGYECVAAPDGETGLQLARTEHFDLIVLDLLLPGIDGISVCRAIRDDDAGNPDVPILMLTARREEADLILGLESGANDYLTKPFSVPELIARAGALTRRPRSRAVPPAPGHRVVSVRGLIVDTDRRRVTVDGTPVSLTPQEFGLVLTLASHPGIVFSREALLAKVWRGEAFVSERSVDELVKRVRQKIEPSPGDPRYIATVWGIGYKFSDD
jgi:DNA-binding response OmpR family regulator